MRIAITGGTGALGRPLTAKLRARGQDEELKNIVGLRIRAMREHLDSALGPAKQLTL